MKQRWAGLSLVAIVGMLAGCATNAQTDKEAMPHGTQAAAAPWDEEEAQRLEKFAISQCLIRAFPDSPVADDAGRAINGYIQLGSAPIEVYDAIAGVVKTHRTKPYHSKSGKSLYVMQCLDLLHDPALEALIRPAR